MTHPSGSRARESMGSATGSEMMVGDEEELMGPPRRNGERSCMVQGDMHDARRKGGMKSALRTGEVVQVYEHPRRVRSKPKHVSSKRRHYSDAER